MGKKPQKRTSTNPLHEQQDDFDKWTNMWDKAQRDGVFKDAPKPPQPAHQNTPDFFGQNPTVDLPPVDAPDSEYWRQVYDLSQHSGQAPDLLQEKFESQEEVKRQKAKIHIEGDLGKYYSKMARSANPIHPASVGKDQEPIVNQNWGVGGKEVDKLAELKLQLYDLESKLNAREGVGEVKGSKSMLEKLERLKDEIDELSDSLNFPAPFDPQADH